MNENKQYHLMFRNFNREAVIAVRLAIKSGLFKESFTNKKKLIKELHTSLCVIYGLEVVSIEYNEVWFGMGAAFPNRIILNKPSLVTYLHEFYHYKADKLNQDNSEDKARGWSISLFFKAAPKLCKRAIEKGLILHQKEIKESKND